MIRTFLFLMALFLSVSSAAETINATVIPANTDKGAAVQGYYIGVNDKSPDYGTVCNTARAGAGATKGDCADVRNGNGFNNGGTAGQCMKKNADGWPYYGSCAQLSDFYFTYICPAGTTVSAGRCVSSAVEYLCPQNGNWTLTGTSCTRPDCQSGETRNAQGICEAPCKSGQTRVNGVCTCDNGTQKGTDGSCCPVAGSGGGAPMQWCYVDGPNASTCNAAGNNGCNVRCNNVTFQKAKAPNLTLYPAQALGQACGYTGTTAAPGTGGGALTDEQLKEVDKNTKNPETAKSPEGCLASGSGYVTVNGVTNCVSSGEGGEVKKTETGKVTETVKNPTTGADETTVKETATTETTNDAGQKSSTTSETTTKPDGSKEVKTTTKTQNPDGTVTETTKTETIAPNGTKTETGNKTGNEDSGTWCSKNPDDPSCKKESDLCKLYPDRAGCAEMGTPPDEGALVGTTKGVTSITQSSFGSSSSCPASIALPKGGSLSFQWSCDMATTLRPLLLALAWLSAGLIVLGAFKSS